MGRRFLALFLFVVVLTGLTVWAWIPTNLSFPVCATERNAAWISADWTGEPVDKAAVQQLAWDASHRRFRYLFPFVTYLQADGSFSPSYAHASEFVSGFRRFNTDTLLLAWMGVPLQKQGRLGVDGWVDLADESVRLEIASFATSLVEEAGFDGVHLDVETVPDGDPSYLLLLDEVRAALPADRLLSVASGYWVPAAVNSLPIVGGYKWSEHYYRAVAARVDQIAAMTYDSLMPYPALYRVWMREQVSGISSSLEDTDVELLVGVSASREKTDTHHPGAEGVANGLAGLCAALKAGSHAGGVAVYAAWEATAEDWETWDRWQGGQEPTR